MMPWTKNRRMIADGWRDLEYLPKGRCAWHCTLAAPAYRADLLPGRLQTGLNAWAARHGLPAGGAFTDIGPEALVLWHGTSLQRSRQILQHGLFHKRGLWTTFDPAMAHSYCRWRSSQYDTEGAVVCLVLDPDTITEGVDYSTEATGRILRFHHRLPADAVQYVLEPEDIRFTGAERDRNLSPWPRARFKRQGGHWAPVQKSPARYSETESYSTVEQFAKLCLCRLLQEVGVTTAMEVFSVLYALISPWSALSHDAVFRLVEQMCAPGRRRRRPRALLPCKPLPAD